MVVLDLEWNSGRYDKVRLDEIIQIGAVKLSSPAGPVVDTFNVYIRPSVHKRYSPAAAKLPELSESERSELTFREAISAFTKWLDGDELAAWGDSDIRALCQNMRYWNVPEPPPVSFFDVQQAFGRSIGATNQIALYSAVEFCHIPEVFDFHNAANDAIYTAVILGLVPERSIEDALRVPGCEEPRRRRHRGKLPSGKQWMGPFASVGKMLNSRGCRRSHCPECGAVKSVGRWWCGEDGVCYSKQKCELHGGYYHKLETIARPSSEPDGKPQLWASSASMRIDPSSNALVDAAQKLRTFVCWSPRSSRRRRARKRGS